ncbi:methionine synthase I (cobalamin-dependent) [Mycobacterium sp. MAA66]
MTAVDNPAYGTDLLDTLSQRVMVGDGALGTQLPEAGLTLDGFNHLDGCNETRPVVIEWIHRNYFEAGAEAAEAKYVRLQSG